MDVMFFQSDHRWILFFFWGGMEISNLKKVYIVTLFDPVFLKVCNSVFLKVCDPVLLKVCVPE